jgi:hypothetical protein
MSSLWYRVRLLCLVAAGSVTVNCGSEDEIDQYADCIDICGRYQDCFDESYDVDDCADRCEDMDHTNERTEIDQCENCLDDRSCAEAVFPCAQECTDIVP